ncbi:hydrogenase subunit MbhD domain-containing protein [Mesotoga prima]|jgi:putative multicomponent Na+:H+ antiporter subunit B|uniref:hydrogenase subunit MbhD domain-containing protein n=1 Tax=Mesotoga prima TaxID=1184387 RepID=UPI002FE106F6
MSFVIVAISSLYIVSAIIVLSSKTNFQSVIWFGIVGSLSAIIMMIIGAPDVAMTQFSVGVALVLIVYIMALKKQRRVRLGIVEVPSMIEETPSGFRGLEWEIIQLVDEKEGYHLEPVKFSSKEEALIAIENHDIDLICGALTEDDVTGRTKGIPYLETSIFLCNGEEIDFVRLKHLSRNSLSPTPEFLRKSSYVFVVSTNSPDLEKDILEGLEFIKSSGNIEEIVGRYL